MRNSLSLLMATSQLTLTVASASPNIYFRVFQAVDETCTEGTKVLIDRTSHTFTCSCLADCYYGLSRCETVKPCPDLAAKSLVVFTHGFGDTAEDFVDRPIVRELLTQYDAVALADWSHHCPKLRLSNLNPLNIFRFGQKVGKITPSAKTPGNQCDALGGISSYSTAVKIGVKLAAKEVVRFLTVAKELKPGGESTGARLGGTHLIGHSLGSHVMGQAGFRLQRTYNLKVGRITGLDPASPKFYKGERETYIQALDRSDARFVDVIHTNTQCLGVDKPVGHLDIFVRESDKHQSIHTTSASGRSRRSIFTRYGDFTTMTRRHTLAIDIFTDAINKCQHSYPYPSTKLRKRKNSVGLRVGRKISRKLLSTSSRDLEIDELMHLGFDNSGLRGTVAARAFRSNSGICFIRGKLLSQNTAASRLFKFLGL